MDNFKHRYTTIKFYHAPYAELWQNFYNIEKSMYESNLFIVHLF